MPKMGTRKLAGTELSNTLKRMRTSRGYTMAGMATMLSTKGLTVYATTIAKIEAGSRAVQIDELVAFADIFDTTTDTLLGHTTSAAGDKFVAVDKLSDLGGRSMWLIQSTEAGLRDAVATVDGFRLTKDEKILRTGILNACDALRDAAKAIAGTSEAEDRIYNQEMFPPEDRVILK